MSRTIDTFKDSRQTWITLHTIDLCLKVTAAKPQFGIIIDCKFRSDILSWNTWYQIAQMNADGPVWVCSDWHCFRLQGHTNLPISVAMQLRLSPYFYGKLPPRPFFCHANLNIPHLAVIATLIASNSAIDIKDLIPSSFTFGFCQHIKMHHKNLTDWKMNVGLCGLIKRFLETIQSFLRFTENWPQISWKWLIDFASAINRAALRQKTHWCRCDKKMNMDWQTERTFTKSNILAYISNGIRCGVSGGDKFFAIFPTYSIMLAFVSTIRLHPWHSTSEQDEKRKQHQQ